MMIALVHLADIEREDACDDAHWTYTAFRLGTHGGCRCRDTARRGRTQRLSDRGTRRLRVRLHGNERRDAAGLGAVFLLDRRDRIDPALRPLCRGGTVLSLLQVPGRF